MFPPHYAEPVHQRAVEAQMPMVDLRGVCREVDDYANESQLSGTGLRKASALIWRALQETAAHGPGTRIHR